MDSKERNIIREGARYFNIGLTEAQLDLLGVYLDELVRWAQKVNLTGPSSRDRIIRELLLDSFAPSPFLPREGHFLDVGSGAGFPAIPLKICHPDLNAYLLEARQKRVSFLKQVIRVMHLKQISVIRGRIDKSEGLLRQKGYKLITARALAPLNRTLLWCSPFLGKEGILVCFQGSHFGKALEESRKVIGETGLSLITCKPYTLPGITSQRHLLVFRRT